MDVGEFFRVLVGIDGCETGRESRSRGETGSQQDCYKLLHWNHLQLDVYRPPAPPPSIDTLEPEKRLEAVYAANCDRALRQTGTRVMEMRG